MFHEIDLTDQTAVWETEKNTPEEKAEDESPEVERRDCWLRKRIGLPSLALIPKSKLKIKFGL